MTRLSCFVLALSLVGCGGSRAGTSACAALVVCCDAGLPSVYSGACSALAKSTDETECSQTLSEIQSASYCASVSTEKGPSGASSHPCNQYLSCLLATQPDQYAAALELYGSGSACWANSAQTAGCDQACDSSFAEIAAACTCTGDTCTACTSPTVGEYLVESTTNGTCGELGIESIDVTSIDALGNASISVDIGGGDETLAGTMACNGTSTFTLSEEDPNDCTGALVLTLTPSTSGTFLATLVSTVSAECSGTGQATTCTATTTITR